MKEYGLRTSFLGRRARDWDMKFTLAIAAALLGAGGAAAHGPPLGDPVLLNIGVSCQWQQRCMSKQHKAMKRALAFVAKKRPAAWRVQQCNRNAARTRYRVDWIGFDNCVRNAALIYTPPPPKITKKRAKRYTQSSAAGASSPSAFSRGERGN